MESYLKALKQGNIKPNFFCSTEYAEKAGWVTAKWYSGDECVLFVNDSDGETVLPSIDIKGILIPGATWSDLESYSPPLDKEFLDYEYIFDTEAFQNMEGGKWSVFRKNSRKWPNRCGKQWAYDDIPADFPIALIETLLVEWLQGFDKTAEICDSDVLYKYATEGQNRKGIFTEDGQLRAMNIWDANFQYINYRYCICNQEPFLSEFARLLFYQDIHQRFGRQLINDGGCLDRISLKDFKDKMNPISVRKVYSWGSK